MTPEQMGQVEELFHAASEAAPEERAALLAHADPEVRRKLDALLSARTEARLFEIPAVHLLEQMTVTELVSGGRLGPYSIETKLGEGGMGEVFRAIDTRLGRPVAVKIAHERFTSRFDREAHAIACLNHPNICTLYDVGPNYLVMELIEGETLASRLKRGPFDAGTVQSFGGQIAAGLAAAHSRGLVHRDLKPGNIMIGPTGIKILDFGLAKFAQDETITASRMILGTPAYMSPEQKQGRPADARSDIYSLGCILHEMSTGARPDCERKRIASARLASIVARCLESDPERRWQSAAEIMPQLVAMNATSWRWKYFAGVAAALAVLCFAIYLYRTVRPFGKLTDKDTIFLAEIQNKTGDPVFNDILRNGMAVELEQSPFLKLISDDRIHNVLAQMGRQPDTALTPQTARQVCERTDSTAVLEGSIAAVGTHYVIWLRATNCRTGDVMVEEQMDADGKDKVLNTFSRVASKVRRQVGESLATVEQYSTPLAEATTPSLEALKLYTSAPAIAHSDGLSRGVAILNHAIELDPQFALAHARLGFWYNNLQEFDLSRASATKAYELSARTTVPERFFIVANYHRQVTGNLSKARQNLEWWAQTFPRDITPHGMMSGFVCQSAGDYEKAIEEGEKAIALDPDFVPPYLNLALSYVYRDRLADAERVIQQAVARKLQMAELPEVQYYIAFLKGDQPGMERESMRRNMPPELKARLAYSRALVLARAGRLKMARRAVRDAVELATQAGEREKAVLYVAGTAVWEALFENRSLALKGATEAQSHSRSRDTEYAVALSFAVAGDLKRAESVIGDLDHRFSEDTSVRFSYLPVLRGTIFLKRGHASEGIQELQNRGPTELAVPASGFNAFFGTLYPAYVRGQLLLAAGHGAEAAKEFRTLIESRGLLLADPVGAVARLQLARSLAVADQIDESKAAYKNFLELWKYADEDIPVLRQAQSEYAKVKGRI